MQVTIRLDDITPDMDWDKFHRFEVILDELGICPIIMRMKPSIWRMITPIFGMR